jgi:hypothetical protein
MAETLVTITPGIVGTLLALSGVIGWRDLLAP